MDWIKLIALGSGMGLYILGTTLLRAIRDKRTEPELSLLTEGEPETETLRVDAEVAPELTLVAAAPADSETLPEDTEPEDRQEIVEEPKPAERTEEQPDVKTVAQPIVDTPGPTPEAEDEPEPEAEAERTKQWFLIKSKTGQVRVCQAWEPTPKTIAGPFATREEADAAKPT